MTEYGSDGFFSVDFDWQYDYVSEEGARLAGQSSDDLLGERVWEIFPALDGTEFGDTLRTVMDAREAKQTEAYYPAHDSWYDVSVYPTENGISIYFRDVTELKERARQFEAIFNNTYTFAGLLEPDGTLLKANNTALEFAGLDKDEVIGKPLWDTHWFQTNQRSSEIARNAVEQARRGLLFQDELKVQGANKDAVIDFTVWPITDESGAVTHLLPEGHEITERKQMTQELGQERDFIEKALDTLGDIFYVVDLDGDISRWNKRVPDVTGYPTDAIAEMHALEFFPADEQDRVSAAIEETLATGRAVVEAELLTANGERIPYELTGARLTGPENDLIGLVGIGRDITDKRARERKLRNQREHLEALNNLNAVVRDITNAVIEQSTRDTIERITCEKLTNSESYAHAWIAEADLNTGKIRPRTEIDAISNTNGESLLELIRSLDHSPMSVTFQTGEVCLSRDVVNDPDFEPWHDVADEYELRSFISVPLIHHETQFGVLGLHSTRTDALSPEEVDIIERLGEVIGYVFYALERKEALGSALELEFRSAELASVFPVQSDSDVALTLDSVVPLDKNDDQFIEYWELNGEYADEFQTTFTQYDPTLTVRLLSVVAGTARFEVSAGDRSLSSIFASQGGTIQSASIHGAAIQLVGKFPETVDPEAVTTKLRDAFPDLELCSQKRILTPQYLRQMVDETLTERQQTVLQIAYFGDHYAQPRSSTGDELAAHLGITKQTFHHHLRNAESKVFELLFEDPDDPLI